MTALDRFDRVFADVLDDLAQPAYPDYIEDALDVATRKRQRPVWAFPERWLPMTSMTRAAPFAFGAPMRRLLLVAIVALLAAAVAIVASGVLRNTAPPYGPAGNGVIAVQSGGDIHLLDTGTGETLPLFTGTTFDVFPSFSRDGTKFAFFRYAPGAQGTDADPATVVVANADGTEERILAGPGRIGWFAWSPRSDALAIVERVGLRGYQVRIVPVAGEPSTVIEVDVPIWRVEWRPPDGRELILTSSVGGNTTLYSVGSDGSNFHPIVTGASDALLLTPDGRSLVTEEPDALQVLRVVDLGSGTERTFGTGLPALDPGPLYVSRPQLSADGTKVIFLRSWDDRDSHVSHQVWVASLGGDGADARPVGQLTRAGRNDYPFVVLVAPDGSQIIVQRRGSRETWVTDLQGGNLRTVDWGEFEETDWQRMAP